jgi:hypothetical protein
MTWHPTTEAYFLFYTYRIYMYMMYSIFAKSHVAQYTPVIAPSEPTGATCGCRNALLPEPRRATKPMSTIKSHAVK